MKELLRKQATTPDQYDIALLLRWGSAWVGAHWSDYNRQWCINLVPFVTVRIRLPRNPA